MIHKFEINNIKIALDVNSGSVHIIDDLVWDILECGENATLEEIKSKLGHKYQHEALIDAYNEIEVLKEQGLLFSKWSVDKPEPVGQPVIKAMCLHAAHDCNLRCSYCFASTGDFKGTRSLLDEKTGRRALEFLVEHSGQRRNLEVDFFGGEPLMNFEVVKKLVAYGRELEKSHNKKFKFTVTTNGLLLNDEIIDFINREFANVVVSIDGRPEVHDNMRKTVNGLGSHGLVLSKAKKLADSRMQRDYFVRGTFTRHNLDFYKDVLYLADQGFQHISIEPVVAFGDEDYRLMPGDLEKIFESYEILAKEFIARRKRGKGFHFFHFQVDLSQGPCAYKRSLGCGAGNEYIAVTPEGDIYPCHQFVGDSEYKMGNVLEGNFNTEIQNQFRQNNIFTKEGCLKCWARFYCSGGCAANGYHFTGSIAKPYTLECEMEKKRLEYALMIKAVEQMQVEDLE